MAGEQSDVSFFEFRQRLEEREAEQSWRTDMGESYMADLANRQEQASLFDKTMINELTQASYAKYSNEKESRPDIAEAWENHQRRVGVMPDSDFFAKLSSDVNFEQARTETEAVVGQGAFVLEQQQEMRQEQAA